MKNLKAKNNKKKWIIVSLAVLIAAAIGLLVYAFVIKTPEDNHSSDDRPVNSVDYDKSSEDEVKETDQDQEERNKQREELDKQPAPTTANIIITYAQQYGGIFEARAYVSNLHEGGGTCTATYRKEGQPDVTVAREAVPDAKTIQCGALDVPRASFNEAGQWQLTITYNSPTAKGSASQTVIIE